MDDAYAAHSMPRHIETACGRVETWTPTIEPGEGAT